MNSSVSYLIVHIAVWLCDLMGGDLAGSSTLMLSTVMLLSRLGRLDLILKLLALAVHAHLTLNILLLMEWLEGRLMSGLFDNILLLLVGQVWHGLVGDHLTILLSLAERVALLTHSRLVV